MDDITRESPQADRVSNALQPPFSTRKLVKWGIAAALLVIGVGVAIHYWRYSQHYVSTKHAYINADRTQVAAEVAGRVLHVFVRDQEHVKVGDPLFQLDPQPFQVAVAAAEARLAVARQSVSEQEAAVAAARAQLEQRRAELRNAQSSSRRIRDLLQQGYTSKQNVEDAETQAATATAALKAGEANLTQAERALGEQGERNPAVQAAIQALKQAQLDLTRTLVKSPVAGTTANVTLTAGSPVQPLVPVFAVINDREYWIDANFKETQLARVRPGEPAKIRVDMYPKQAFRGRVQSVNPGSGSAFSLLPPENATGNWVKVTQRVPVRVRVLDVDPRYPLRVGTTATVQITVR